MAKSKKSKAVSAAYPSGKSEAQWRAEGDMRTLADAHAIKSDPKRHAAAKECARCKLEEMKKVAKGG
jgi:hypothetical protein